MRASRSKRPTRAVRRCRPPSERGLFADGESPRRPPGRAACNTCAAPDARSVGVAERSSLRCQRPARGGEADASASWASARRESARRESARRESARASRSNRPRGCHQRGYDPKRWRHLWRREHTRVASLGAACGRSSMTAHAAHARRQQRRTSVADRGRQGGSGWWPPRRARRLEREGGRERARESERERDRARESAREREGGEDDAWDARVVRERCEGEV